MYHGLHVWEQGRDRKPQCRSMVGMRCPLSPGWTSSQLLTPVLSCVIRLPAKGLLSLTALCRITAEREGNRCAKISGMKLISHVQESEIWWLLGLRLSVLGWDVNGDLGPVTFCSIMPVKFLMGKQYVPFSLCLKSPFPISHFCLMEVTKEKLLLTVNWSWTRGGLCLNISRVWRRMCALCLKDSSEQLNRWSHLFKTVAQEQKFAVVK